MDGRRCATRRPDEALRVALRLRELLTFEFFFSGRREFRTDVEAELAVIHPDATLDGGPEEALGWLRSARLRAAHSSAAYSEA